MKPEIYKEYSKVYDFFSSDLYGNLTNSSFMKGLIRDIPEKACVTDVGGGTGVFALWLLQHRPDIKLTFIEPSPSMFEIAVKRLPLFCNLHNKSLEEVLPYLENQDIFIFMRVLYALYSNVEEYKNLFMRLYEKLNSPGYIFIYDVPEYYNIKEMKKYVKSTMNKENTDEFSEKWPVMKGIYEEFNKGVSEKIYKILEPGELNKLFISSGFVKIYNQKKYIFTKKLPLFDVFL